MSKNAVAKKEDTAVAVYDYGEDAGGGFDNFDSSDMAIPMINVLQPLSKLVMNDDDDEIKPGMLYNTVTQDVVSGKEGFLICPCATEKAFVEWIPQTEGGGFVASYAPDSETVKEALAANNNSPVNLTLGNNDLMETHYIYCLILDEEGNQAQGFAVIPCSSSKIKVYKKMTTATQTLRGKPPLWANRVRVKTVKEQKDDNIYFNLHLEPMLNNNWAASLINPGSHKELYEDGKLFAGQVLSGLVSIDQSKERVGSDGGPAPDTDSDEAPF